ncbi:MAG: hypothetical protein QXV35_00715 [Archaeoglobaceae archaeon]
MGDPLKALVVGCGYMGRIHSANLRKLGVEVFQFDIVKEKCESYLENLAHPADILVIATPIETHYRIFSELYEIHGNEAIYFIEKPVVENSGQFRKILETGADIFVGHQLRYSMFYGMIRKEIESGSFDVEMEIQSPADPRAGLILDTGIHFVDLPIYYLGSPESFEARGNRNSFDLILHYSRGFWRIRGELKDYYRIDFSVNGKKGVSDGISMSFDGREFRDLDFYYEEMKDVVLYAMGERKRLRISLESLMKTYEIAFEVAEKMLS